jgi:TatD DNase family protein
MRNIHTHHRPAVDAVLNVYPQDFAPREGEEYSVGIHPWYAESATPADWERLRQAARHPQVVLIGECGLDKLCDTPFAVQQSAFERQVLLSEEVGKPLLIHCVKCYNEVLACKRRLRPRQPWIIHGFRGKPTVARTLLEAGCSLSYGARFNPESVRLTPPDRLFVETDDADISIEEVVRRVMQCRISP